MTKSLDSFKCARTLKVGSRNYLYYSLPAAEKNGLKGISRLPFSLKVLLENLLRNEDGRSVTKADIQAFAQWLKILAACDILFLAGGYLLFEHVISED